MKNSSSKIIKITQKTSAPSLSRAQKLFNRLIKQIDVQRQILRTWQTSIPLYQQKHANEYAPLVESFNQYRARLVLLFDRMYQDKALSKTDRETLADLITDIAGELLANDDDPELKSLFNKYSETDFDTQNEAAKAELKDMLEQMFEAEIEGEIDPTDIEAMHKLMAEKEQEMREREAAAQQAKESHRKKSAKQLAKEDRLAEEEKNISLSIREVFRKLASALHPDREQDVAERARKTSLMQRVNVAYGNKDLLRLLELQLEVEQIDQTMIDTISDDRLKHYNQILTEQSSELEMEVGQTEAAFRVRFQIDRNSLLAPAFLLPKLGHEINRLQHHINGIKHDLVGLEQPKKLKAWLKKYRLSQATGADDF